tara:strand:+ start:29 stop:598 length:570 start_codon:yes stop_codon:yes gene_type:complete
VIIKDKNKLEEKCVPISVEEGEKIGVRLLHELRDSKIKGVGLAANQIGINKRVCVINVKEPLVLINPKIVEKSEDKFIFPEGCLSFPKKYVRTERYVSITVEADNHKGKLSFSADSKDMDSAMECVCVQHEIDHLDGITMFNRKFVKPAAVSNKIGRNEKVTITKDSESKVLKYKKAQSMLEDGWTLSI